MSGDYLLTVFALGTLGAHRTGIADFRIAFEFPIASAIGCGIVENLTLRAEDAVIVFIINILVFLEEAVFCLRAAIGCAGDSL